MKKVIQLDSNGYFVGFTLADPSPLEPDVYLLPANTIDAPPPDIPEGKRAKWCGDWILESIPQLDPIMEEELIAPTYADLRAAEYPSFADQFDLLYHGGMDAWKAVIEAVKIKYPKPAN